MEYNFREVEKKWQEYWAKNKTYKTENTSSKPKYYVLDMFPYPSGAGLHVGHPLGYIASDIFARFKRLKGFNVLHPMGYDSFGLPAEQYAIQTGQHPEITTKTNIARYREQLDKIGFSYDWDREVRTSDPSYYKWTQWVFIQLFNCWYNKKTNKAEKIETLISEFEKNGNYEISAAVNENWHKVFDLNSPIFSDYGHGLFTADRWNALDEKTKNQVLLSYRMAYLADSWVNWCPALGTVLANDEVKDGVSERGGHPVEQKYMQQWSLRITAYAERLLKDLETIDWTESIKEAQRNWIGKSEGTSLKFKVENSDIEIEIFTTRPDTVFGVSFVTLAPESKILPQLVTAEYNAAVAEYLYETAKRTERERSANVTKISGQFTGSHVLHPFTGKRVPIWIGDYVLAGYGTGAVMAVPSHDTRDFAFANHFGLDKKVIIQPAVDWDFEHASYDEKEGKLVNSDFLDGLEVKAAIKKAIAVIEEKGLGKGKTNFRLRDAIFGRQRYWGEPIPVYYKDGIPHVLSESELPLVLPEVDKYLPTETGEPPLARAKDWKYKGEYEYEYSTMPGWAGSSWYFLRYMDARNDKEFASKDAVNYWQNVDLYMGGAEHATGHLLYVRFWTKFLYDLGLIPVIEPAKKLINQGMIQGMSSFVYKMVCVLSVDSERSDENEAKSLKIFKTLNEFPIIVSKNRSESVTNGFEEYDGKDEEINKVLSKNISKVQKEIDELKAKITFMFSKQHVDVNIVKNNILQKEQLSSFKNGEYKDALLFTEENGDYICGSEVEKMSKSKWNVVSPDSMVEQYGADCLRLYEMFLGPLELSKPWNTNGITGVSNFIRKLWRLYHNGDVVNISNEPATKPELKSLHKTIKKITEDIERFSFNTSVSNFMICVNELTEQKCNKREILEPLAIIIAPYAPHVAEELWSRLGHTESVTYAVFPECKEEYLVESSFNYPVSFNGKTRFFQEYDRSLSKEEVEKEVMSLEQTQKYLEGKTPKKVIVVPNKIVNIVV